MASIKDLEDTQPKVTEENIDRKDLHYTMDITGSQEFWGVIEE